MAVTCWMPNCLHNNFSHTCRFFKFPKDPKTRSKWLKLIRSDIQPKPYSTVCSCHFPEGKKEHGPQVLQNIKIRDVYSIEPSTLLESEEIHKIEDMPSGQSSPSQDLEMVLTENSSSSSFQDFEIVLISEPPIELHEFEELKSVNASTSQRFQKNIKIETSAKILKIEDNFSPECSKTQSFPMNVVAPKNPEIKNNFSIVKPSTSQHFQRETKTYAAKIQEIEKNSNGSSSMTEKTLSTSTKNHLTSNSQPPPSFNSIALLEAENYFLKKELDEAKKLHRAPFNFEVISENDKIVSLYTGLPNATLFDAFYQRMENIPIKYRQGWKVVLLSRKDQLFMTLMKVRHNFPHADLAFRFNVSESVVANVISTWIHVLHEVLREQLSDHLPATSNKNKSCLSTYANCRIVSSCAEVSATVTKKSQPAQALDPLNVKLLVKLWSELHLMVWPDKRNRVAY